MLCDVEGGVRLSVWVKPRASRTRILGEHAFPDGRTGLAVALAAPPVDGEANRELLGFLAKTFALPRSKVVLVSGATSREKTVLLASLSRERVISILSL